jgi:hypothetical protein
METTTLTFLPFFKHGFNFASSATTTPGYITAQLSLLALANGNPTPPIDGPPVRLRGPGDILGITQNVTARLEPPAGKNDFEPNYFPFVEFADPDFLWRYSLETDTTTNRMTPWLCLIVLTQKELEEKGTIQHVKDGKSILRISRKLLPPIDKAWANGHTHFVGFDFAGASSDDPTYAERVNTFVSDNPSQDCSRLFCMRRLEALTNYTAFLVATYKDALLAFTESKEPRTGQLAWSPDGPDSVDLPIYFQWTFRTSERGDFEELARRLVGKPLDGAEVGFRAIDCSTINPAADEKPSYFQREGALCAPGFLENAGQPADPEAEPTRMAFTPVFGQWHFVTGDLNTSLNDSLSPQSPSDDPLVSFPVYGQHYPSAHPTKISQPVNGAWTGNAAWLNELNLDLRYRIAGNFGTVAVQKHQEEYSKSCWCQVGKIREANEKIRRAKAALLIGRILRQKHLDTLTDARFVYATAPFHSHIAQKDGDGSQSVRSAFGHSGIAPGVLSATMKRVAHQHVADRAIKPFLAWDRAKNDKKTQVVSDRDRPTSGKETISARARERYGIALPETGQDICLPKAEVITVREMSVTTDVRQRVNLQRVLHRKLSSQVRFTRGDRSISETFDPIMLCPSIDDAMYLPLVEQSSDLVLPGVDRLTNNIVTLCSENRRFIEAYMVGLNHEMGRELVWREYPTDQRGTIFSFFWDPAKVAEDDEGGALRPPTDIDKIHEWKKVLGLNKGGARTEPNLVLLIKGDVIRRYPETIIYAVRLDKLWRQCTDEELQAAMDPKGGGLLEPIFRATLGADILAVGFYLTMTELQGQTGGEHKEYYFILQEHQDLPRFGLDVQSCKTRRSLITKSVTREPGDLSWGDSQVNVDIDSKYITNLESQVFADTVDTSRRSTSATIAKRTYQKPIRVIFHSSLLLPD